MYCDLPSIVIEVIFLLNPTAMSRSQLMYNYVYVHCTGTTEVSRDVLAYRLGLGFPNQSEISKQKQLYKQSGADEGETRCIQISSHSTI